MLSDSDLEGGLEFERTEGSMCEEGRLRYKRRARWLPAVCYKISGLCLICE